jgi:hypothetical protein
MYFEEMLVDKECCMAAADLPYLVSYKNVGLLFEKIAAAKAPDAFTTVYLVNTLGLKSTADRAFISLLKALGFLDGSGKPTPEYMTLKNSNLAGAAIAKGIQRAYAPLFAANEKANEADPPTLKGLIAQVTGSDAEMVKKIQGTFQALVKKAKFGAAESEEEAEAAEDVTGEAAKEPPKDALQQGRHGSPMRPEFHYNIQIHLPANATEETYLHIFNAMRKSFA